MLKVWKSWSLYDLLSWSICVTIDCNISFVYQFVPFLFDDPPIRSCVYNNYMYFFMWFSLQYKKQLY